MKIRLLIPFLVILLQSSNILGQRIVYQYDNNGNRIRRTIIVEELESDSVSFPVTNPEKLSKRFIDNTLKETTEQNIEDIKSENFENMISESNEIKTKVFPNPTLGNLNIEILNMPTSSGSELKLYDLNGNELLIKKQLENFSEIDISYLRDGIYILRIRINERVFDWKIIKNH
jgi:hypothetical protein